MSLEQLVADAAARLLARLLPPRLMRSRRYFELWESRGYHVTPVHFRSSIPDSRTLSSSVWSRRSALVGLDLRDAGQIALIHEFARRYRHEYEGLPRDRTPEPGAFYLDNVFFTSIDAELLYCMVRHFRPRRLVEIGSGFSTRLAVLATNINYEETLSRCEITAIDPEPRADLAHALEGRVTWAQCSVESVPLELFENLERNDIVFIDSSHVLRVGGDVQHEFLEILPRLKPGVLVHVHDVYLPAEYPTDSVVGGQWFMSEQHVLQAFLAFNRSFEILLAGSYLHLAHPQVLRESFSAYVRREHRWPVTSFWIRRCQPEVN